VKENEKSGKRKEEQEVVRKASSRGARQIGTAAAGREVASLQDAVDDGRERIKPASFQDLRRLHSDESRKKRREKGRREQEKAEETQRTAAQRGTG
jgi:hypothetical protein